jgi:hypothetical protein
VPKPDGSPTSIERVAAALGRGAARLVQSWRALDAHQKIAAGAALALVGSLALPWFQLTGLNARTGTTGSYTVTGFGCFTFVEGSILLVCGGALWMLFARGEERAFHLPGGDGSVIALAGAWCLGLLAWRIVLYPPHQPGLQTGIEWGVMISMGASALLLGAGLRMRAAHIPEPPIERQLTLDGHAERPVIPAPAVTSEPDDTVADPTVAQMAIPLEEEPRQRKRTRRKSRD